MKNATGPSFPIFGTTSFKISLIHPLLISWLVCVQLKLIHSTFPLTSVDEYCKNKNNNCLITVNNASSLTIDIRKLLNEFPDVIHDSLNPIPMKTDPMHIYLKESDERPLRISTAREIPKHFQAAAERCIRDLLDKAVIEKVDYPTGWCSPAFFVPKANNIDVRLVTDFTHINKRIVRPVHPFASRADIMQAIPPDAFIFAKLDAVHGYFQLALDNESADHTTFLLPSGRFRYKRAPMGLSASSDEWCQKYDYVVNGLPFCKKIIDDILIWAKDENELINNCRTILNRCRELNISISEKKLEISHSISFAGHIVSNKGITPDPNLTTAIKDFPQPTNISELRSFMGLANQLASFIPDLAQNTSKICKLFSPFLWLPDHEEEFQITKRILCSNMIVKPFDQTLQTNLVTDASRLHGLGFALLQLEPTNNFRLIQCGSKSLNDTQRNYATIELECLDINHAIKKCKFYLNGKENFTVITDHKPLLGIFNKNLDDLDNPRLQRMREKVMGFKFNIEWIAGKSNLIADALSRTPKFTNNTNEICKLLHCCIIDQSFIPLNLKEMANIANDSYKSSIKNSNKEIPNTNIARQFQKDFHKLSISNEIDNLILINSSKIVIPDN